jgi:hypothetical protein
MSAEQGVSDWVDIIDQHHDEHGGDAPLVLQPSEVHRLREDLCSAYSSLTFRERQLVELSAFVKRYDAALDRTMVLVESYKKLTAKTADIARIAISSRQDDGYTTRPYCPADRPGEETLAEFSRRA